MNVRNDNFTCLRLHSILKTTLMELYRSYLPHKKNSPIMCVHKWECMFVHLCMCVSVHVCVRATSKESWEFCSPYKTLFLLCALYWKSRNRIVG